MEATTLSANPLMQSGRRRSDARDRRTRQSRLPVMVRCSTRGLCLAFAFYAVLGRGFAYVGVRPFFVGEGLLALCLICAVSSGSWNRLIASPLGFTFALFGVWQTGCTLPYLASFGVDCLRDAVIWGYAAFAWCTAAVVCRYPLALDRAVISFRRFAGWYVVLGPVSALATAYVSGRLPRVPGTDVTVPHLKPDDMLVHLSGIIAYVFSGMTSGSPWWFIPTLLGVLIGSVLTRGGLIALLSATAVAGFLRGFSGRVTRIMVVAVLGISCLLIVALVMNVDLRVPGKARELSADQMIANVKSIGGVETGTLDATKRWRLQWWETIVDYTFYGPYFWTGKGYGVNLADSDGFQVGGGAEPLRSPHNSHLTFLARSGVPGFISWICVQLVWVTLIGHDLWRSRRMHLARWRALFIWLLSYWLAFVVNACFDVSLEGPMSAIPFWSIFGVGWGAHILFARSQSPSRNAFRATALETISPEASSL